MKLNSPPIVSLKGVPPVSLRSIWYGAYIVNEGQAEAGFAVVKDEFDACDTPLAMADGMEGLSVVMKLPQIAVGLSIPHLLTSTVEL